MSTTNHIELPPPNRPPALSDQDHADLGLMLPAVALAVILLFYFAEGQGAPLCGAHAIDDGSRCHSITFSGLVVHIADGDTLTVLDATKTQRRIRLAYIDAPESRQAYGNAAKQSLAGVCFRKTAKVATIDTDRYGRTVALVSCEGVTANAAQLTAGFAWVYTQYAPRDFSGRALEQSARAQRLGLWADESPVPPWLFRKRAKP